MTSSTILLAILGQGVSQAAPAKNLELPSTLTYQARSSSHPWVDAETFADGVADVKANCTDSLQQQSPWAKQKGDADVDLDVNEEACADFRTDSLPDLYDRWGKLYATSVKVSSQSDNPSHLVLSARVPVGASPIQSVSWCYLQTTLAKPDDFDALEDTYSKAHTLEEAQSIAKCTTAPGPKVELDVDVSTASLVYWYRLTQADGTVYDGWGRRSLDNKSLIEPATLDGGQKFDTPSLRPGNSLTTMSALTAGIDQGAILVGLTDYMLERANAELRAWAIDSQLRDLCMERAGKSTLPGSGDFLPNTCAALDKSGIGLLFSGASILQGTARADMHGFMKNLGEAYVVYDNGGAAVVDGGLRRHDFSASLAVLGRTLELILNGEAPADALAGFAADGAWAKDLLNDNRKKWEEPASHLGADYPVVTSIYLTSAVLASLPMKDGHVSVPMKNNKVEFDQDYLSYLTAATQYNIEKAGMSNAITGILGGDNSDVVETVVRTLVTSEHFGQISAAVERIKDLKAQSAGLIDPDDVAANREAMLRAYGEVASSSLLMVQAVLNQVNIDRPKEEVALAADLVGDLADVASQVASARYGLAITETLGIASRYIKLNDKDGSPVAVVGSQVLSGLGFVASLAGSDSPQAAQDTIAAWAAPVGSYLRKHDGDGAYAGLNGYVGAGGGFEWLMNVDEDKSLSNRSVQAAPALLVGADVGWRFRNDQYLGGFVSLLDLGAIATVRANAGDTEEVNGEDATIDYTSKLKFQQVFSPGFYVMWAPCRVPFSFGAGASLAASLREISVDGDTAGELDIRDVPVLRASAIIALDLPLNP